MNNFNPEAKVIDKVTGYATDKDGTAVRITFKVYETPIVWSNETGEMLSCVDLEFAEGKLEKPNDRFYGASIFFGVRLTKEQITKEMDYMKCNIDNYKYPEPIKQQSNDKTA